jgi:general secretion pathway protein D
MPRGFPWKWPVVLLAAVLFVGSASRCLAQTNSRALPPEVIPTPAPVAPVPSDFRITDRSPRGDGSRRTAAEAFPQKPLPLVEFRAVPLGEAMQIFAEQTGLNIVASPEAAKTEISVFLRDVRPLDALDALTKANDLYYLVDEQSQIIRISTTAEYQRSLSSFREERTEVFTLLYPNPAAVALAIRNVFGDAVQLSFGDSDQFDMIDLLQRLNRFDLIDGRSLGLGIGGVGQGGFGQGGFGGGFGGGIGRGGVGGFGGGGLGGGRFGGMGGLGMGGLGMGGFGYGGMGGMSGMMGGTQGQQTIRPEDEAETRPLRDLSPEQIQQLEMALAGGTEADRARLSDFLQQRRATIFVTVIRRNNQVIVRTGDERTMEQIRDLVMRLDVPTPLVLLEVKVLRLTLGDEFNSAFDYQFSDGATVAGGFTTGNILPPLSDNPSNIPAGQTRRDLSVQPGGSGLNSDQFYFQAVNDSFRFRLQLLENNNRVTTLATPLLLTANNEVSRIFIGETLPFTVGFTPGQVVPTGAGTANTVTSTPITELRDVGQSLLITPNINADRTVTLRIVQEQSEPVRDGARIPVADAAGGIQEVPVDTIRRNTVSGTVVGMDGLTVALGGLIEERVRDQRAEVPVVGKLPVVGFFFRRQTSVRERAELVILIRPYVFNTPAESALTSEELMQQLSIHPASECPMGTMGTFAPHEVIRANPPLTECQKIFRFHSLEPKRF